jgi:hypothetical protein
MAIDPNEVNAAIQQFLQADKDLSDAEATIADAQATHARNAQLRAEAKAKVIAALG